MNAYLAKKSIKYFLHARHRRGHGIHSPFVYDLIRNVFIDKNKYPDFKTIESRRKELLQDSNSIDVVDFGAGSINFNSKQRKMQDIASSSLSPKKYAQLLFRLIRYSNSKNILEVGSSLGISGSYLALANVNSRCVTLEGAPSIANVAKQSFESCSAKNIEIIVGNFSETLPTALKKLGNVDFAFVDGNHQKQATLDYFEQILPFCNEHSILIFDDIYWSKGMSEAWELIKKDTRVSITIDVCKFGIVFFRKGILKQDFVIRY